MPAGPETASPENRLPKRLLRARSREALGLFSWAFEVRSTCPDRGPGSVAYRVLSLAPARVLALPPGLTDVGWLRVPEATHNPDT